MGFHIGQKVKGKVTGIQPYGIFVQLDDDTQGLVHISEITHGFVENIKNVFKIGKTVEVVVLDIDEYSHKISLSTRALEELAIQPSKKRKYHPRYSNLKSETGFQSIAEKMPEWIEETLKNLKEYKVNE